MATLNLDPNQRGGERQRLWLVLCSCRFQASQVLRSANEGNEPIERTCRKRNIDFALYKTGRLAHPSRRQVAGVADHDLVYYDFRLGALDPVLKRPAYQRFTRTEVSDVEWEEQARTWDDEQAAIPAAEAYLRLMDTAEEALVGELKPGAPRCETAPAWCCFCSSLCCPGEGRPSRG